jgi:hypothetical protein
VRGRWTGRTLRLEIEADAAADLPLRDADALSHRVETADTHAADPDAS